MPWKNLFNTPEKEHFFSGYYDRHVLSDDGQFLLCLNVQSLTENANAAEKLTHARNCMFNLKTSEKIDLGSAPIWNFQQGNLLQFIKNDTHIIHAHCESADFLTRVVNLETEKEYIYDEAFYDFSESLNGYVSINHKHYSKLRPGYAFNSGFSYASQADDISEIYIKFTSLENGKATEIVNISNVLDIIKNKFKDFVYMYFEHLMFSPNGLKLAFLFRVRLHGNNLVSHLLVYDFQTKKLKLVHARGRFTHYTWLDSDKILGWQGGRKISQYLRQMSTIKPFLPLLLKIYKKSVNANSIVGNSRLSKSVTADCYGIIDTCTSKIETKTFSSINYDGHPNRWIDNKVILDSYPKGTDNEINIVEFNMDDMSQEVVFKIQHPLEFNNTIYRCDSHPKVNLKNQTVVIDRIYNYHRNVAVYQKR